MRQELLTPDIIKMAKSLKRQIVEITPHYICGTDSMTGSFSIIYPNEDISMDDDLYYFGAANELNKYDVYLQNMYNYDIFKQKMQYLRYQCQMVESNKLLLLADDITKGQPYIIDGFPESLSMKARDGATILSLNSEMLISTCSTMHPINKPDVVSVSAYEYNDISFIVKFIINKKKYIINEYVAYLYL